MAYQVMEPGLMLAAPPAAAIFVTKPSTACNCWHGDVLAATTTKAGALTCYLMQVVHKEQYDDKRQVLQEATTVDDMYDMLAVYEQKVVTADQVSYCSFSACCQIMSWFVE